MTTPDAHPAPPSLDELARHLLRKPADRLDPEERRVLEGIRSGTVASRDAAVEADRRSDVGDRLADKVAAVGGSWSFIAAFSAVMLAWMLLNSDVLRRYGLAFDPYPYVFLNLMLSTLAAIQAPIIMMSQNRQSDKDRVTARSDYETNLRAELDLMRLQYRLEHGVVDRLKAIEAKLDALAKPPRDP